MKTFMILIACFISTMTSAQQFSEKINKEFVFEKKSPENAIIVANINGNIKVTGYEGDKVIVEVNRQISGKTEARLQKGKEELQLGILDRADTLIFYVQEGCNKFGQKLSNNKNKNGWDKNGWGYNWDCKDRDCQPQYDYKLDFTIKVPAGIHLALSTINEGDIVVENVKGTVDANNINGSIKLSNLVREADASTINGDVDIEYTVNPSKDCRFYTLNGDINAVFQKGLAASLSFESFNGSFYTNMDNLTKLPAQVVKSSKGDGIKYKLTGNRYQIGNGGGAYLDFETFNGNVYLKEKLN